MNQFTLHLGDCLESMRGMADNSIDAVVCDPPYELTASKRTKPAPYVEGSPYSRHRVGVNGDNKPVGGFMGKEWDGTGIAFSVELWAEVLRVLKPGGHLLAFSGTRTYHRMGCAIEDAGFEIRDQIQWIFGSGFPKSRNIASDMEGADADTWSGWGTALKPANEPICMARKPLATGHTVAANVLAHGTGALNIDGCRVAAEDGGRPLREVAALRDDVQYSGNALAGRVDGSLASSKAVGSTDLGRWPANLIHDGSDDVVLQFPAKAGAAAPVKGTEASMASLGNVTGERERVPGAFHGDTGSAARFFYCAKASKADRDAGLDGFEAQSREAAYGSVQDARPHTPEGYEYHREPRRNIHPTVKPTDLMAYLVRLVTPSGGVVLDPFMGSGSTGKAAMREGARFIGCEMSPEYMAIAQARIEHELALVTAANAPKPQPDLFGT